MECAGKAERRRRFRTGGNRSDWRETIERLESGVALRLPPQSKMAGGARVSSPAARANGSAWAEIILTLVGNAVVLRLGQPRSGKWRRGGDGGEGSLVAPSCRDETGRRRK
jgi:hypothetical protein